MYDYNIDYNEHMLSYYPEVIKAIREFKALIATQSQQVESVYGELTKILLNAYVVDADDDTIEKWEEMLGIVPLPQGDDDLETYLSDRKETILARLYNTQSLNTASISEIVKIFTGGEAVSYFKNGTIHVLISPPKNNKQYKFANVEQELSRKVPAHLMLNVSRSYNTWGQVNDGSTWDDVAKKHTNWEDVLLWIKAWETQI